MCACGRQWAPGWRGGSAWCPVPLAAAWGCLAPRQGWGLSGSTRPASCTHPGARMAHSGHRHRVVPEDVLEDAPLCLLRWMAKVSLSRVWDSTKPTHPHLCDGPQAPYPETLLFGSLTHRGSRCPHYKYVYVCVYLYMAIAIRMYMLCI